jgi:alcohol dehydrogenase class IV
LGATYRIPHGITSCLTLAKSAALKARTSDAYSQENLARAARRLQSEAGIDWKVSVEGETEASKGGVILGAYIEELVRKLGLATSLKEWKVPSSDLEGIAKMMQAGGLAGAENQPSVAQVHELLSSL